mgnify:CR=1 FL=1
MSNEKPKEAGLSRRAILTRLGLAAGAAYAAPVLLRLGEAHASSFSRSRPGRSFSGRGRRSRRRRRSFT